MEQSWDKNFNEGGQDKTAIKILFSPLCNI